MDYAINTLTNKVESADQATGSGLYVCPCCKTMMSFRAGTIRKKYFAHWPGLGTAACENYVPGQHSHSTESSALKVLTKRRMDLRLIIPKGGNRAGWSLELVMPSWRACDATVIVDVGGRFQKFDMRMASNGARTMVELSTENFRIVSFDGVPDPLFKDGVETECLGLPASGAAVFTASERGEGRGFPRAQELRCAGTYALLWKNPATTTFPSELVLDWLNGRQGWNIALVTIPEKPSSTCVQWLQSLTGLTVNAPAPYILPVWPFLTRNSSINTIEYAESPIILLSAHMISVGLHGPRPSLQVYSGSDRISATAVNRSPALFVLRPERVETFRVGKGGCQDLERIFTCAIELRQNHQSPTVQAVFTDQAGACEVVGFHQNRCKSLIVSARAGEIALEYLAMPPGARGRMITKRSSGSSETKLFAGVDTASHNRRQRLLPADLQSLVVADLIDSTCDIDIDFYGFGRLRLLGNHAAHIAESLLPELGSNLRARLYSFMSQLQIGVPVRTILDDQQLVSAFFLIVPRPELVPHHRALMKKVLACGFKVNSLEKGLSS